MESEQTKPTNNDHIEKSRDESEGETQHATLGLPPIPPDQKCHTRNLSPEMQSPPIQAMGGPGYDPARIPTSIFSSKPTNPAEWSCTSNESLFSIHMGNNSFSRDYAILFGKSGDFQDWNELPRLDEWSPNNNTTTKPSDPISPPTVIESPLSSVEEINSPQKKEEKREKEDEVVVAPTVKTMVKNYEMDNHENDTPVHVIVTSPTLTDVKKASPEKKVVPATNHPPAYQSPPEKRVAPAQNHPPVQNHPPAYQSPPRFSNDSGNSCKSFAFPVLVSESRKPESLKVVPKQPEHPVSKDPKENPRKKRCFCFPFQMCCCCCRWPRCC